MTQEAKKRLKELFPGLKAAASFQQTSDCTLQYNCIAWAAGDDTQWWWPLDGKYWPTGVPRELTMESFERAFQSLGYERCDGAKQEKDFEKIVIYASKSNEPTHASRQLADGKWTSKIGRLWDIWHAIPANLNNGTYGEPKLYMKRPLKKALN